MLLFGASVGLGLSLAFGAQATESRYGPPVTDTQQRGDQRDQTDRPPLPAYRSPLEAYRRYQADEPMRPWRDVNDEVERLGGHIGHLRQARTPNAAQPGAKP